MSPSLKTCAFCDRPKKMTSEHVWGEWTKGYVERTANKHNHANVFVPRPGQPEPPKVRIRAGDHLDAQVHVVCSDCNSGWLSQIQNDAKPVLIHLFEGRSITLDQPAQQAVAAWVAMSTMTGEHLSQDQRRVAIPQSDRTWLMDKRTPPPGLVHLDRTLPTPRKPYTVGQGQFPSRGRGQATGDDHRGTSRTDNADDRVFRGGPFCLRDELPLS